MSNITSISQLNHKLPQINALLLLSSFQSEHVYPAKHGVNSTLERFETFSRNLRTWRELQPAIRERWCKPLLPDVDPFFGLANTGTPVCDGISA